MIRQLRDLWRSAILMTCAYELAMIGLSSESTSILKHSNNINNPLDVSDVTSRDSYKLDYIKSGLIIEDVQLSAAALHIIGKYQRLISYWSDDLKLGLAYEIKHLIDVSETFLDV